MRERVKTVLAVVLVSALAYVLYTQLSGISFLPVFTALEPPKEPDVSKLATLKALSTVEAVPVPPGKDTYDLSGRNLFQYGKPKPPPPSPAELEAQRKAEEARLKAMEEDAKRRAAEQARLKEEQAAKAKEAMEALQRQRDQQMANLANQKKDEKKPPPTINLKLVGWLGKPRSRIAVFLRGDEIVLAGKGEVIEGKFKVLSLGPESVTMGYVDPTFQDQTRRLSMGS